MSDERLAVAALVAFALCTLLLPWYALGEYVASGWQATWLARVALIAAVAAAVVLRLPHGARTLRIAGGLSLLAVVLTAIRVAVPPDFGFDFGGLEVPVERRFGVWVALGVAALASLALFARARPR